MTTPAPDVSATVDSLVDLLQHRAQHDPNALAYTFLEGDLDETGRLTYADLDARATALARVLETHVDAGDRVLMLYPPGLGFVVAFFACLYAGVIGIPAYPPKQNRSLRRLRSIVHDADAALILTVGDVHAQIVDRMDEFKLDRDVECLATDEATDDVLGRSARANGARDHTSEEGAPVSCKAEDLAYLQYTSGSTSAPKGVRVTHRNLLRNLLDIERGWGGEGDRAMVTWLPIFHDMGLIYGMLFPMYGGFPCYMMAPTTFVQRPYRWLKALSDYDATHTASPNFGYELCLRKIDARERDTLDLSAWQVAVNGAEPVRAATVDRFVDAFGPHGFDVDTFCPGYGLAETTLVVAKSPFGEAPVLTDFSTKALRERRAVPFDAATDDERQTLIGYSPSHIDTEVAIADPDTGAACTGDQVGEIWVKGSTVADGYWNRDDVTEETFHAHLAGSGDGPYLRTGDLGCLRDDTLYVVGRLKDVIIIRGRNYYPQDVEHTVEEAHPALRPGCGAAFSIPVKGEERLALAQEVRPRALGDFDVTDVVMAIRDAVAKEHDLEVFGVAFVEPRWVPKTSSGKIQRRASCEGFLDQSLREVGRWVHPDVDLDVAATAFESTPNA